MTISPALTTPEIDALKGASFISRYLSPVQNPVIGTARINQASFTYPIAQITVDGTSGGWSNVAPGDTVFIGSTSGTHDKGIYRVRKAGNSTTLYIGEIGGGDPGLLPESIRTVGLQDNDYITVVGAYNLWSILPRINANTGTIYEDYDLTPGTYNTTPPPLTYIYINGRRNHYFDLITTADTTITADASVIKWPTSSGSTVDYAWTVPAEWTGVSGDTTDTLTATAPPGNYILYCTITDSIGGAFQRVSYVNIHDNTINPPLLISNMPRSDVRDRVGRRISFDLYDDRLTSLADGAAVGYFEVIGWSPRWAALTISLVSDIDDTQTDFDVSDASDLSVGQVLKIGLEWLKITNIATDTLTVTRGYNGTAAAAHTTAAILYWIDFTYTDVPTATRQFVGWFQRVTKEGDAGLRQATIDLISPAHALGLLNSTSQVITKNANPSAWQQAVASLMSASFMAWYMLQWRTGNLLRLFNFTTFSTDPAEQRLPQWQIDKGTILGQIQLLATDRGNFGCNSEGEFFFLRLPQMVNYADRSTIVTRDELDASIYKNITISQENSNRTQQVRGEAFSWNGSAPLPTPYLTDAPKSPGQGGSPTKLLSQVVTGQSELDQLTGDWYAKVNNKYPSVSTTILSNRDVYEPAELSFVQITVPDYLSPDNAEFVINIVPLAVGKAHNVDGTSNIELTGEGETTGVAGAYVPVPKSNTGLYTPPYVPQPIEIPQIDSLGDWSISLPTAVLPTDPAASDPSVIPGKGAIRNDGTRVWRTYDVTLGASTVWDDVTPSGAWVEIVMVVGDNGHTFSRGAYCLANDGTDSLVIYTSDIYATTPAWATQSAVTGLYQQIESTRGIDGEIYLSGVPLTPGSNCDLTNWVVTVGTLVSVTSSQIVVTAVVASDSHEVVEIHSPGTNVGCIADSFAVSGAASVAIQHNLTGEAYSTTYPFPLNHTGLFPSTQCINAILFYSSSAGGVGNVTVDFTADDGCGSPASASGPARSNRSQDYGVTFESEQEFGTLESVPGFDVGCSGLATIAGDTEQVVIAEDGGTYAADSRGGTLTGAYPIAVCIPDMRPGSASFTNISATPSYIFQTASDISGETLFSVITSRTAHTPSVGGFPGVGVSPLGLDAWRGKLWMAIADVTDMTPTTTRYLFVTKNTGGSYSHVQKDNALSIRAQRFNSNGNAWILALGTDGCEYSADKGATWTSVSSQNTLYAELFG